MVQIHDTASIAAERGYTRPVRIELRGYPITGYVRPGANLDGRFGFFDELTGEHLALNGWMVKVLGEG